MEAGVDSLAATELASRVQALAGITLAPTLVFEHPTPRAIAAHIVEQLAPAADVEHAVARRNLRRAEETGASLALVGIVGQWPGGCNDGVARWRLQAASGDGVSSVPSARWVLAEAIDESAELSGELSTVQLACAAHGGFVSGAQRFDSAAFGISPAEARATDPQQRRLLELGYAALHGASCRRATLMGGDGGVSVGIERPDWALAQPPSARRSVYAATGDNVSVAAGRLCYVLGLQGPCSSVDTACSSALVAAHGGARAVAGGECGEVVALAVSLKLMPHATLVAAAAGMLSVDGRCKTFDARANGYVRSDGVGALVVRRGDGVLRLAGCAVRQDGRSASLTAPNGSAQRVLLVAALDRAALEASDVGSVETHGTGTALGDPTEAGSLAAVHGAMSHGTVLGAAKANVGHSEAASGQIGLLRAWRVLAGATMPGHAHLRVLNPLVEARVGPARLGMPTASVACRPATGGVSSFGYSGTIAHALLQGAEESAAGAFDAQTVPPSLCAFRRRAFPWREASHPFAQRRLPSADGASTFSSPAAGALHALVADHVVQGRVLFPAAGYLELGRAAAAGGALCDIFFVQPLVLDGAELRIECVVRDGRFEVRSGEASGDAAEGAVVHCSGGLRAAAVWERVDHASRWWRSCAHAAAVGALYDGFDAAGLQYGPGYRTLERAWASAARATARLRARSDQAGTAVHPADLDDALCVGALMASGGDGGATRLPFAVDDAMLQGSPGQLVAVRPHALETAVLLRDCSPAQAADTLVCAADARRRRKRKEAKR